MKSALLHVSLPFILCVALANTSLFQDVAVDLSYEHYAERRVEYLPAFLAMPCNCLVNLAYIYMGLHWLLWHRADKETEQSRYMRQVFAFMAIFYAPVQWTRLAVLRRAPAVLDQWFTLPIFAWVPVWISFIERGPAKSHPATLELFSLLSYGLSLAHDWGFEVALGCHIALAVYRGVRAQLSHGDRRTLGHLLLALLSCAGFVVLKLLDHWLARYRLFQRFTGHFWSKVCDVLQFHFTFCFLTALTHLVTPVRTGSDSGFLLDHNRASPAILKSWWEQ
uniref:Transmembrane protein 187 n=1 Tax=Mastacembelus armatus TaxID=205130 RepID=A0A3Q3RL07_9TELE